MWAARISDNPDIDEDEPELLLTAAIHAREVNTPDILFYYVDYITDNYAADPEIRELVDNREIWIIPVCNPDGYYYNQVIAPSGGGMWRMNRRDNGDGTFGVDVNRNFGYMWGYDDVGSSPTPGYATYRGTAPFSEPETQALRDFMIAHEFVLSNHWHQFSNITIFPWGYDRLETEDKDIYNALGDTIYNMNGYVAGPVWELLYPVNGGAFDWDYGEQALKNKVFGFTMEAGTSADGFWPTLERAQIQREENLEPMLFLTRLAGNIYVLRPPRPPQITGLPSSVDGAGYSVNWAHTDQSTPAVAFELVELQQRRVISDPADSFHGWTSDQFSVSTDRASSAPASFYSGRQDGATIHLQTQYPYIVKPGDQLTFRTYYSIEFYYDFAYVEISRNGRAFTSIPGNITTDYNPYGNNLGNGITSSSGGWVNAIFDLSDYEGESILIQFTYVTDANTTREGFYIDDISPHLVFDSETVVATDISEQTYNFTNMPMGVYYYQVRARDAENQWGELSAIRQTHVLNSGTGDPDLDGIDNSVADLAIFSLYFQQGLSVFDIYQDVQSDQTDFNCDAVGLTADDLTTLAQIVVGTEKPCFSAKAGGKSAGPPPTASGSTLATDDAAFAVELQSTSFDFDDSAWVDIVLIEANTDLLGFQIHLRFNATGLMLQKVRLGDEFGNWQLFDHHQATVGDVTDLTMVGVAQSMGDPVTIDDIDAQPLPVIMARLKFDYALPGLPLSEEISFVWSDCGDNALVAGAINGADLAVDSLALSRFVYDADGVDITGSDPDLGGASYTCFYGMFGTAPANTVDFSNERIIYDPTCCVGRVGDANLLGGDEPTIGDISVIIDHLFISGVNLECLSEADVNQTGGAYPIDADITIGDVSTLVDYLFITGTELGLADCF
jgi:hypothetical protein